MYVCMYGCMHVLIYLFNSIQRTFPEGDRGVGHLPQACWGVSGQQSLLQTCVSSLDPLSFREAARGKQQPSPLADLWPWAQAAREPDVHSITSP